MTPLSLLSTLTATWLGSGFLKPAPGTWGSLAAVPFGIALIVYGGLSALLLGIAVVFPIGLWSAGRFAQTYKAEHDDKRIVIDEVLGQWIAMIPLVTLLDPVVTLLAFLLFRLFDIIKPWPICWLDRKIEGAWGVMLDDALAGLAAGFVLLGLISVL